MSYCAHVKDSRKKVNVGISWEGSVAAVVGLETLGLILRYTQSTTTTTKT